MTSMLEIYEGLLFAILFFMETETLETIWNQIVSQRKGSKSNPANHKQYMHTMLVGVILLFIVSLLIGVSGFKRMFQGYTYSWFAGSNVIANWTGAIITVLVYFILTIIAWVIISLIMAKKIKHSKQLK